MARKTTSTEKVKTSSPTPRTGRTKHITHHCVYCGKETKMAIVGEMEGTQNKMWYKCTRCRHMSLLQQQVKVNPNAVLAQIDLANCITYKPDLVYSVGQFIFHNDLKDAGRIVSKARTSSGGDAIIVNFERIGKKTLIENLRGDFGFEAF